MNLLENRKDFHQKGVEMKQQRMMRILGVVAVLGLLVTLQVAPATAEPLSYPNGPWVVPAQEVSLESIRDYEQLVATLENIAQSNKGAVTLAYAPYPAKGSGRLVPYAIIGSGPRKIIVVAQQHGDEFITSNGMISLIRALSSNAQQAKFIRDELTVIIVPRVNIDGFDATPTGEPWRYKLTRFARPRRAPIIRAGG
jgi:murein tripeptide amidase MpaA